MVCFQVLVSLVSLTGVTTGFLFDDKCVAPPPCTCSSMTINCGNKYLSQVPVFSRHNEQYTTIYLYLSNNQLTTIPAYAFKNLSAVKATNIRLDLYNNHISNIEYHAFSGVTHSVTDLILSYNNLTHLPLALTELTSLYYLDLQGNPLVTFDASVLANISSSLYYFFISVDRFSSFPNELQLLTRLSELKINNITFPILNATVFHSFENSLTSLEMSSANFESIPSAVCKLKFLKYFTSNFSPNLGRINTSIFEECNNKKTNVSHLSLQYGQLTTIPKIANIFPSLQLLNLYHNNLHFIEGSSLAGLTSLRDLHLGSNHLTRIPFAVNMAFNLRFLFVDNNQIDTVEDMDLSHLHNLTGLNLNNNPIVYVSSYAFTHNPLLFYIDMRSTDLGHVPRALLGLNNLHELYLDGTPIECSCQAMDYLKSWNVTSIKIDATCSSGKSVKTYLTVDLPKCP